MTIVTSELKKSNDLKIMLEFISKMEPGKNYGMYDLVALLSDDLVPDLEIIQEFRRHNNHWAFQIINLSVDIGILSRKSSCYILTEKAQELKIKLKNQLGNEVVHEIEQIKKINIQMNATE